jgi:hypothetical protein
MIRIKDHTVLEGMLSHPAHPALIELLKWFVVRYSETVFTCGYEVREKPGVHSTIPFRGMDVRSTVFEDPKAVETDVNEHWMYDPDRPQKQCCILHNTGRGMHLHLQACDATVERKP